jgi:hypothetical protein
MAHDEDMSTTQRTNTTWIPRPHSAFDKAATKFARSGRVDPYVKRIENGEDERTVTREWAQAVRRQYGVAIDVIKVPA